MRGSSYAASESSPRQRDARVGRDPRTGKAVDVPAMILGDAEDHGRLSCRREPTAVRGWPAIGGVDGALVAAPSGAPDRAERLRAELGPAELFVTEFTPVIGAHVGPGLVWCALHPADG